MDKGTAIDLERGLLLGDEPKRISPPGNVDQGKIILSASPLGNSNQGKPIFAKLSDRFVGGSLSFEGRASFCFKESNSSQVSMDLLKLTNNSMMGQTLASCAENTPAKEKLKKSSNKKAPKPPRPPQPPLLDAADHKLIREITELAMLKRARVERMKALRKMKAAKSASSSAPYSSVLALIFTIVFCIVIIFQGMSSGKHPVVSFQGSPLSLGGSESDLISVQYQLNPSASESNAPGSEYHNFVQPVAGSDLAEIQKRDSGYNALQSFN